MDSFNILMHAPTKYSSPTPSYIIITTMVRFVSHKEHQELSMQSSPQQLPKHHQRSTLSLLTSSAVKQSQIIVMQISPPGRRVQTNAMQTTQLPRLYNLYNNYPRLLVADGQQERDQVPVNIWTQPTVRLTTYLMRMRTAVVIVKKIYRIKLLVSILSCCRPLCSALTFLDEDSCQHLMRMMRMIVYFDKSPPALPPSDHSP